LNSGRRWGNDVPTCLDLSRDIDILSVQVSDRSTKQNQMGRRLTALEATLKQVPCNHACIPKLHESRLQLKLFERRWRPSWTLFWQLLTIY
jgi:hypothetical protein